MMGIIWYEHLRFLESLGGSLTGATVQSGWEGWQATRGYVLAVPVQVFQIQSPTANSGAAHR